MSPSPLRIFSNDSSDSLKLLWSKIPAAISGFGWVVHEESFISGSSEKAFFCSCDIFHGRKDWILSGALPLLAAHAPRKAVSHNLGFMFQRIRVWKIVNKMAVSCPLQLEPEP